MPTESREFTVFLASPGDMSDERQTLRTVIDELSANLGTNLRFRVRALGWENTYSSVGRPQEIINEQVDSCDVFIGILGRRWGSPTGEFSSGFEEEFRRALARHRASGKPEIGLYFKRLDDDALADPGPELQKVLRLKDEFQSSHELYYEEFENRNHIALRVSGKLSEYLSRKANLDFRPDNSEQPVDQTSRELGRKSEDELPDTNAFDSARGQLAETLTAAASILNGKSGEGTHFDPDRILLFATALNHDHSSVPTHAINRLYSRRDDLQLVLGELRAWLYTFLSDVGSARNNDANRVIPGWAVLLDDGPSALEEFSNEVVSFLQNDIPVSTGAATILTRLEIRPNSLWPEDASGEVSLTRFENRVALWASIIETPFSSSIFDYLAAVLRSSDRDFVQSIAEKLSHDRNRSTLEAIAAAVFDDQVEPALSLLIPVGDPATWIVQQLHRCMSALDHGVCRRIMLNTALPQELRSRALSRLLSEDALDAESCVTLLSKPEHEGLQEELFAQGLDGVAVMVSALDNLDIKQLRREVLARLRAFLGEEQIRANLAKGGSTSIDWWEALMALPADTVVEDARRLLRGEIEFSFDIPEEFDRAEELVTYYEESAVIAAVARLARDSRVNGAQQKDVDLVKPYLNKGSILQKEALAAAMADLSTAQEVPTLLAMVDGAFSGARKALVERAVELGGETIGLALAQTDDHEKARSAATALTKFDLATRSTLVSLCNSNHGEVRKIATEGLTGMLSEEELKEFLRDYVDKPGRHYYNVVAILDEFLFAPSPT